MLLARRVVNPPKIKNHRDTAAHIEKWQECRRKLEQEYGCKVEPGLQKAILIVSTFVCTKKPKEVPGSCQQLCAHIGGVGFVYLLHLSCVPPS